MRATSRPRYAIPEAVARALALGALAAGIAAGVLGVQCPQAASGAGDVPTRSTAASLDASETTAPLPARMAWVGDSTQLVVATAAHLGDATGLLQVFELRDGVWVELLRTPAWFGRRGLRDGQRRVQGDRTTPTGIWRMPDFAFGASGSPPAGTKLRWRHITMRTWWSSRRDRTFNTWVVKKGRWSGERLAYSRKHYEFAVSTGFNAKPNRVSYKRGSCIFLHVHASPGGTAGCVAVSRADMARIVQLLDPARRPRFAAGTLETGTPTSIYAY